MNLIVAAAVFLCVFPLPSARAEASVACAPGSAGFDQWTGATEAQLVAREKKPEVQCWCARTSFRTFCTEPLHESSDAPQALSALRPPGISNLGGVRAKAARRRLAGTSE